MVLRLNIFKICHWSCVESYGRFAVKANNYITSHSLFSPFPESAMKEHDMKITKGYFNEEFIKSLTINLRQK